MPTNVPPRLAMIQASAPSRGEKFHSSSRKIIDRRDNLDLSLAFEPRQNRAALTDVINGPADIGRGNGIYEGSVLAGSLAGDRRRRDRGLNLVQQCAEVAKF